VTIAVKDLTAEEDKEVSLATPLIVAMVLEYLQERNSGCPCVNEILFTKHCRRDSGK